MIKRVLIWLAAAAALAAAPVTITDTVPTPMGGLFTGRIIVSLDAQTAQPLVNSSGVTLSGWSQTYTVVAGIFTATLEANDAITPTGTSYRVQYIPSNGSRPWTEVWLVPTSVSPLQIGALRSSVTPTPPVMISPQQISSGGATAGQGLVYSGTSWGPASLLLDVTTTQGDLIYRGASTLGRLPIGSTNQVLGVTAGLPAWMAVPACATCVVTNGSYADPSWLTSLAAAKITGNMVSTISGTANQITASASTGAVTLSLPSAVSVTTRFEAGGNASSGDMSSFLARAAQTQLLASGGAHGFRDESTYNPSGSGGYAAFDAIPTYTGSGSQNHYRAFQARPVYSGSGAMDEIANFYSEATINGTGTVTSHYGVRAKNALGSGTITTQYGFFCEALTRGSGNYCLFSGSTSLPSYHGGRLQLGTAPQITAAGYTTYGAILGHDASGNLLTNPYLTIVNGVLTFGWTTAKISASAANLQLASTSGYVEVNNGTAGDYRDLYARNVTATTFIGALTGNATTATALYSTVASGRLWIGQGTGAPTSDSVICADTTNHRLGVGTCSPGVAADLRSSESIGGVLKLQNTAANGFTSVDGFDSSSTNQWSLGFGNASAPVFAGQVYFGTRTTNPLVIITNTTERARFAATTGNFLNGTATDLGYGLHAAKAGTAGNFLCYDPTATTGTTKCVFKAGQGQSGEIILVQSYAGSTIFSVNATGGASFTGSMAMSGGATALDSGLLNVGTGLKVGSGSGIYWNNSAAITSTNPDTSLTRVSAGVIQAGDGGANANGKIAAAAGLFGGAADDGVNKLQVSGGAAITANGGTTAAMQFINSQVGGATWYMGPAVGTGVAAAFSIYSNTASAVRLNIDATGDTSIGGGTATDHKLDVQSSGSSGTFRVFDQTATTGNTKEVIRAGAGQSTNLTEWQNGAGSVIASVGPIGQFFSASDITSGASAAIYWSSRAVMKSPADSVISLLNNAQTDFARLCYGLCTSSFPALKRSSAILQARLADDSAYTDIQVSSIITKQTTPSASTDACTAGSLWADASYVYACTASGTIKRATLNTF